VQSALPEVLRPVKEYSDVIYTLILLAFMILMPHGLIAVWHGARRRLRLPATTAVAEARR
jgi:ABC-type branched-subunit amino acid transport system permease subunit